MAFYLVRAQATGNVAELKARLDEGAIRILRPFGKALEQGLQNARLARDGRVLWEEEDYCDPPLAMERAEVLDAYFSDLHVERVQRGEGWRRIAELPGFWKGRNSHA